MQRRSLLSFSLALLAAAPAAFGQIQPVSFESFDYAYPSLLDGQGGGTGWANSWVSVGQPDLVIQANAPTNPMNPFPWPSADPIGNYCQQAVEFGASWRLLDQTGHDALLDNGKFGADGATMWFSYTTVQFQQFGDHYGGFSLWEAGIGEKLFTGSPWASYGWGIDDQQGTPMSAPMVPGSNNAVTARIVVRVDWLAGDERVRMWVDPAVPHPTTAADIDHMMPDFRFDEVRLSSGGNASLFYWDNLVIQKGEPAGSVGTNYCGPAIPNSTGLAATISGVGSTSVAANSLTLTAEQLPVGQFGYFLTGRTQGFFNPPGSMGIICLTGDIGRYNAVSDIIQGPSGSLAVDLTNLPTNTPGSQMVMPGESINFQCWYRDGATSNFTDGLNIVFN